MLSTDMIQIWTIQIWCFKDECWKLSHFMNAMFTSNAIVYIHLKTD